MRYFTRVDGVEREFRFERRDGRIVAHTGDGERVIDVSMVGDGTAFSMLVDGASHDLVIERSGATTWVQLQGERIKVDVVDERERAARAVAAARGGGVQQVEAVMPGVVVDVMIAEGDTVEAGQTLLVLEAMKMQNPLQADEPGIVRRVLVEKGAAVAGGALLVEIDCGDGDEEGKGGTGA